ncbi:MAG: glutamine synthetase type III, partial [Clostridia bacterium]|nr:glutamine synthetase type III [Clostridia bacterium]
KITCDIYDKVASLEASLEGVSDRKDKTVRAFYMKDEIIPKMNDLRTSCDEAEYLTAEKDWPYPTYASLLFGLQ